MGADGKGEGKDAAGRGGGARLLPFLSIPACHAELADAKEAA